MTPADRPRFALLIAALVLPFRQDITEMLIEGYWLGLDDLPLADVERAVKRAARESKWMPSVAELRELAGAKRRPRWLSWLMGTGDVRALPPADHRTPRQRGWPER